MAKYLDPPFKTFSLTTRLLYGYKAESKTYGPLDSILKTERKSKTLRRCFYVRFSKKSIRFGVTHVFFFSQGYTCSMEKTPFVLFRDQIKVIIFLNKRTNTHTHTQRNVSIHSFIQGLIITCV